MPWRVLEQHLLHCRGPKKHAPMGFPGFRIELPEHVLQATEAGRLKQFADGVEMAR